MCESDRSIEALIFFFMVESVKNLRNTFNCTLAHPHLWPVYVTSL